MDISATIKLSPKSQRPKSQQNNPAIQSILQDLVSPGTESPPVRREKNTTSRIGSKRNSLDKQSVQTLAQDLAAECAKAYALMESSLSKLSNELGVTPFGLAPKNKVIPFLHITFKHSCVLYSCDQNNRVTERFCSKKETF